MVFDLREGEFDLDENFIEPLDVIIDTLKKNTSYQEMIENFPDIRIEKDK